MQLDDRLSDADAEGESDGEDYIGSIPLAMEPPTLAPSSHRAPSVASSAGPGEPSYLAAADPGTPSQAGRSAPGLTVSSNWPASNASGKVSSPG